LGDEWTLGENGAATASVSHVLQLGILGFCVRQQTSNVQKTQVYTIHHEGVDLFEGGSLPDIVTLER